MSKSEIKKFIQNSLKEIQESLPKGFRVDDKINFEISVVTKAKVKGGLDIKIASLGSGLSEHNIHKIRFSIVDEKAQAKAWEVGQSVLAQFLSQLAKLDSEETQQVAVRSPKIVENKKSKKSKELDHSS